MRPLLGSFQRQLTSPKLESRALGAEKRESTGRVILATQTRRHREGLGEYMTPTVRQSLPRVGLQRFLAGERGRGVD